LGLSIALEDARLHGGFLQAWGEPGWGSVFRLTLPWQVGGEIGEPPLPLQPADGEAVTLPEPRGAVDA
jgi:two-component system sensor histidine kinase MtrB